MRKIFVPLELGKDLLDITPKAQFINYKIDKLNFIKINNFCYSKDIVKRIKRQVPKWEKYLQIAYLAKQLCLEYIQNVQNSIIRK